QMATRLLIPGYEVQRDVVAGDRQRPSVRRKGQAPDVLLLDLLNGLPRHGINRHHNFHRAEGTDLFARRYLPKTDRFMRAVFDSDEDAAVPREYRADPGELALAALAGGHFPKPYQEPHLRGFSNLGNLGQQLAVR